MEQEKTEKKRNIWRIKTNSDIFNKKIRKTVMKIISYQVASILVYMVAVMGVMLVFADERGDLSGGMEMLATAITVAVLVILTYKPVWYLGDQYSTLLVIGKEERNPLLGLKIGLLGISPILASWLVYTLFYFIRPLREVTSTLIGWMLYPWSPYFEWIAGQFRGFGWFGTLFYLIPMVPIPLTAWFAFRNGTNDIHIASARHASSNANKKH